VESLANVPLKGKVGTTFGSYGWSGEGPIVVLKMLSDYGMNIIEPPLRVKRNPEEEALEECRKLGKSIADKLGK
jgi:flavorubredoxin